MTTEPTFHPVPNLDITLPYSRFDDLGTLDRFNLAQCARRRMIANATDGKRWKREHLSFRSYVATIQPLDSGAFYDRD